MAPERGTTEEATLVLACGALAHEIVALRKANAWSSLEVQCLPAELHNFPDRIPGAVRAKLEANRGRYRSTLVAYGDCGTGGELDRVLDEYGVERIPGAHCYEFYAGPAVFAALADAEPGSFYLTDFLLRHFERLVIRGLGLDRNPELAPLYFGNYRRLVYLAQRADEALIAEAQVAAQKLGLAFEYRHVGYGGLETSLQQANEGVITWHA
ncbi:DUF1638 domain-containing protein [Azoarcus sp. KH32C]|uniref:DUF1638 domain-containing protein n=1 Tax=Azoarcus sp. KH32C TaxID=748247 RepID=UPI0002385D7B|nr:DUF1638 domain-containing protein [Azoarcus sp. KH32C]BAL27051.1 hypothetical protein AZKH_p0168 [Azoarcus sp. KH32C]